MSRAQRAQRQYLVWKTPRSRQKICEETWCRVCSKTLLNEMRLYERLLCRFVYPLKTPLTFANRKQTTQKGKECGDVAMGTVMNLPPSVDEEVGSNDNSSPEKYFAYRSSNFSRLILSSARLPERLKGADLSSAALALHEFESRTWHFFFFVSYIVGSTPFPDYEDAAQRQFVQLRVSYVFCHLFHRATS